MTLDVGRELYYQNVSLVGSQRLLDTAVRDICSLLKVPAWNLGVTTTSKGLIAGPVSLVMEGGDVIDCMAPGGKSCWISESVHVLAST
jgi:meiotic recombination protein SPO11